MASLEERSDGRTVQLKAVRLSFTNSLKDKKPTTKDGSGRPKHTLNVILERNSPHFEANEAKCVAAMREAGEQFKKKPDLWKSLMDDDHKRLCFKKGERMKTADGDVREHYAGNLWISGAGPKAGDQRPKLLDRKKQPVAYDDILDVFYGGVVADVVISYYATDKGGSDGLFCSVEAIRSHQVGDRFPEGGGINVDEDDFDDLDDDDFEAAGGSVSGGDEIDDL